MRKSVLFSFMMVLFCSCVTTPPYNYEVYVTHDDDGSKWRYHRMFEQEPYFPLQRGELIDNPIFGMLVVDTAVSISLRYPLDPDHNPLELSADPAVEQLLDALKVPPRYTYLVVTNPVDTMVVLLDLRMGYRETPSIAGWGFRPEIYDTVIMSPGRLIQVRRDTIGDAFRSSLRRE